MNTLVFLSLFVAVVGLLYWRAESLDVRFASVVDSYEDVEDPYAELYWGSGIYRLSADQDRIIDSTTGKSFIATRDEIADIKFRTRVGQLTCDICVSYSCPFRGDAYNVNGDCLATK